MHDSYSAIFSDVRASEYHAAMAQWPDARAAEFEAVLAPLTNAGDGLLCDLPAGGGYLARYLRPGLDYLGVEPGDGFFDDANRGLNRIRSDLSQVALDDRSVDHIVSLAGLHHEDDLAAVFGEMRRFIRPGGRLVIADAAEGSAPAHFLNGFVDAHNPQGHDGRFLNGKTVTLLEYAGFNIIDEAMTPTPWIFASPLDAGAFCKKLFWLPDVSQQDVADALADQIGFTHRDGRTVLNWSLRRLVCDAR